MRYLIAIPTAGLCNRMRMVSAAIEIAQTIGAKPIIIWILNADLNAKFNDLFDDFPYKVYNVQERFAFWLIKILRIFNLGLIINDEYSTTYCMEHISANIDKISKYRLILCNTFANMTLTTNFSYFKVRPNVHRYVEGNTIGIHIRRTDNVSSILHSPTELFIEKIKHELEHDSSLKFYLSTDDPQEESYIKNIYGDAIISHKKRSYDRNTNVAIQDALIDLYNLSQCKKIYGSYYSSFSDVSAWWGGIEKEVVYA